MCKEKNDLPCPMNLCIFHSKKAIDNCKKGIAATGAGCETIIKIESKNPISEEDLKVFDRIVREFKYRRYAKQFWEDQPEPFDTDLTDDQKIKTMILSLSRVLKNDD